MGAGYGQRPRSAVHAQAHLARGGTESLRRACLTHTENLTYTVNGKQASGESGYIRVFDADLTFGGGSADPQDTVEDAPGFFMAVGTRKSLSLRLQPADPDDVMPDEGDYKFNESLSPRGLLPPYQVGLGVTGGSCVDFYDVPEEGTPLGSDDLFWGWKEVAWEVFEETSAPAQVYVQAKAPGTCTVDLGLMFRCPEECGDWLTDGGYTDDHVKVTVVGIVKIPLGGSAQMSGATVGKVYVPTKWGGTLGLGNDGQLDLFYTNGADLDGDTAVAILKGELEDKIVDSGNPCIYTVPQDKVGWYYVRKSMQTSGSVVAGFLQMKKVSKDPWTCPWYPMSDEQGPNLYDANGCLHKYDTAYGTHAREVERRSYVRGDPRGHYFWRNTLVESNAEQTVGYDIDNADNDGDPWTGWDADVPCDFWDTGDNEWGQDGDTLDSKDVSWYGHCDLSTAVVICEAAPTGNYPANGVEFNEGDKKGLLVALYHGCLRTGGVGPDIRPCEWHSCLEEWIIGEDHMFACDTLDMADEEDEVSNHPVYEIKQAWYSQKAGQSDEKVVQIDCQVNVWDAGEATEHYDYWVSYGLDGVAFAPSGWVTQRPDRPDFVWMPVRHLQVDPFWDGQLDLETIQAIIPIP